MTMPNYEVVKTAPVAKFYYQGPNHSHPVRRTVLLIQNNKSRTHITGYELREGHTVRTLKNAPVKTYRKDRVAKFGDYSRLRRSRMNSDRHPSETTLSRLQILELLKSGA